MLAKVGVARDPTTQLILSSVTNLQSLSLGVSIFRYSRKLRLGPTCEVRSPPHVPSLLILCWQGLIMKPSLSVILPLITTSLPLLSSNLRYQSLCCLHLDVQYSPELHSQTPAPLPSCSTHTFPISENVNATFAVTQGKEFEVLSDSLFLTLYLPATSRSYHFCLQHIHHGIASYALRQLPWGQSHHHPLPWDCNCLLSSGLLDPYVHSHSNLRTPFKI